MKFTYLGNQSNKQVRSAYDTANLAYSTANSAYNLANTLSSGTVDTIARETANAAFLQANSAFNAANNISSSGFPVVDLGFVYESASSDVDFGVLS